MSAHIRILIGIVVAIIPTYTIEGLQLLDEDLNNILDVLKPALGSRDKVENDVRHHNKHLSDTSILKLLEQVANNVQDKNYNRHNSYSDNSEKSNSNLETANYVNINQLPALYKYLVSSFNKGQSDIGNEAEQDAQDLDLPSNRNIVDKLDPNDYSKIYLVLDPKVNLKRRDINEISDLISSVFKVNSKDKRYKGFLVRDNSRRRRNSKENYSKRDSMENEYKPKRARKEHQGGGGRTAIPYIRHRGDIYEKPSEFD